MLRVGSVCSGFEGLSMGLEEVFGPVRLVFTADIDPGASKILAYRYPDAPNLGDISLVDWSNIPEVDILTAGFPCQSVSGAGRREGMKKGTRTGLWFEVRRAIDELRPPRVLLENVLGLYTADTDREVEPCEVCVGNGSAESVLRALPVVCADLAEMLYDIRGCTVRASDIGAPHRRERVFILATHTAGQGSQGPRRQAGQGEAVNREAVPRG
jgi:DNA (cytosine-5)-methyltransferase 1